MTPIRTLLITLCLLVGLGLPGTLPNPSQAEDGVTQEPSAEGTANERQADEDEAVAPIRVALLTYGQQQTGICFADAFLATYSRETGQQLHRSFDSVALDSEELFDYPFVVLSGERAFEPTPAEKENLKRYLDRGGFLLASAGCSNNAWAQGFVAMMSELFGQTPLKPIPNDHLLFHTLYDIDSIDARKPGGRVAIYGYSVDSQLRVLFSPLGLNDTSNAGGGCCCCGGSEIRNARLINANALAYALLQ
ncbi:MAG: DUF4159 domain-containing protein [Planctomycetota bacterium]